MTARAIKLSATTPTSPKESRGPGYYALLARVGHQKKKASQFQDETAFYIGIVIELLALSVEQNDLLQALAGKLVPLKGLSSEHTSQLHNLVKKLHSFWPTNIESQERLLNLLACDGLGKLQGTTPDGLLSLSTDRILRNVAQIIEATKESNLKA